MEIACNGSVNVSKTGVEKIVVNICKKVVLMNALKMVSVLKENVNAHKDGKVKIAQ